MCVVCVCAFSSDSFWTSSSLDAPAGVTQEEGHTGFLIHLLKKWIYVHGFYGGVKIRTKGKTGFCFIGGTYFEKVECTVQYSSVCVCIY